MSHLLPSAHGPFGAKGVGEPPAIPGPAAVANAIRDAVGVRVTELPMRAQVVVRGLVRTTPEPPNPPPREYPATERRGRGRRGTRLYMFLMTCVLVRDASIVTV
jgi:hypothetical protein